MPDSNDRDRTRQAHSLGPQGTIAGVAGPDVADTTSSARLRAAVDGELERLLGGRIAGGLYLVATPIGNLGDITLRALAILHGADVVYCEDTRVSQILFSRYGMQRRLSSYHEHSDAQVREHILSQLENGQSVALISDAGTPGISDPGFKLVRAASLAGHTIVPIPGPSALLAAVAISGLPIDRFMFVGFLSAKSGQREGQLKDLAPIRSTLVVYESPHRLAATLADMTRVLGNRQAIVGRELTKRFEEIVRGTLDNLAGWSGAAKVRGEIVIAVGPPIETPDDITDDVIAARLAEALTSAAPSLAAKQVAEALGVPKARVYDIGLRSKRGDS
ncbi:MAG TPA: 16S rRNA (cytidine(1402)-2'-O)-methyltransferase [Hyphomicrobiaceae bacterium]|nr:16S rRNA (cytidine(1402)-2'-O)-methyltransferase [Hyphomicrobiaceae bacterium]